ncbi:capsular polysaccharide synthesis protein [Paracoccaceae bacterium GXU_MW_L88]
MTPKQFLIFAILALKKTPLRALFLSPKNTYRAHKPIPRDIYMFWDSGFENAPEIVRFCVESWRRKNPDWTLHLLTAKEADGILPRGSLPADIKPAHYADLLRLKLMVERGGVWADGTCLCMRPLDEWLMIPMAQAPAFMFTHGTQDRKIANWFMASQPDAPLFQKLSSATDAFWAKGNPGNNIYYWMHHLVDYLLISSASFRAEWKKMAKLSAIPVHRMQRLLEMHEAAAEKDLEILKSAPVQKLTYKSDFDVEDVRHMLDAIGRPEPHN